MGQSQNGVLGNGLKRSNARCNQSIENAGVAFVKGADERNKFFEKINSQKCMTNKGRQTRQRTSNLRDEPFVGMNSASELTTAYNYMHRSIRGSSQSNLPGDKAWGIIAPIE